MYAKEIIPVLEEHVLSEKPVMVGRTKVWVILLQIELNRLLDFLLVHEILG